MNIRDERERVLGNIAKSVESKQLELSKLIYEAEEIAKRLKDARDAKDLSENSAYDIAVAETKMNAKQTAQVKAFIDSYESFKKLCDRNETSEYIRIGSTVLLETADNGNRFTYIMVPDELADGGAGALSELSHPGKVIMGQKKGTEVLVRTSVKTYKCRILDVY